MHAKHVIIINQLTKANESYGYDLIKGDFVAPLGKGMVSDMTITYSGEKIDAWHFNSKANVKFSNAGDGLIVFQKNKETSEYKSAYQAPLSGYVKERDITNGRNGIGTAQTGNADSNNNYYFRIRTVLGSDGSVESAYYGKIYGEFPNFTYYLNPTPNDRNVEFDTSKNLFKITDRDEEVSEP